MSEKELATLRAELNLVLTHLQKLEASHNELAQVVAKHEGRIASISTIQSDVAAIRDALIGNDGGDTLNETKINVGHRNDPKWIAVIVIALIGAVAYLVYIGGWNWHGGEAAPPEQRPALEEVLK